MPPSPPAAKVISPNMGFRFQRRKSIGRGFWLGLGKSGPSIGRRGKRISGSFGSRGPRGSVRIMKGLSYLFGRR